MNRMLVVFFGLLLLVSCTTNTVEYPDFWFTETERFRSKRDFNQSSDEILFFLMIDKNGKIVHSKIVDWKRSKLKRVSVEKFKRATYKMELNAIKKGPDYRQVVYSMNVNTSFEWR